MTDRKLIYFDNGPSYRQQITVFHLFREHMACSANCTAVGGDQAHWLSVLSETENKDSGDLGQRKDQSWIANVLAYVTESCAIHRNFSPKNIAIGL